MDSKVAKDMDDEVIRRYPDTPAEQPNLDFPDNALAEIDRRIKWYRTNTPVAWRVRAEFRDIHRMIENAFKKSPRKRQGIKAIYKAIKQTAPDGFLELYGDGSWSIVGSPTKSGNPIADLRKYLFD